MKRLEGRARSHVVCKIGAAAFSICLTMASKVEGRAGAPVAVCRRTGGVSQTIAVPAAMAIRGGD
jgi:hypothetical protein